MPSKTSLSFRRCKQRRTRFRAETEGRFHLPVGRGDVRISEYSLERDSRHMNNKGPRHEQHSKFKELKFNKSKLKLGEGELKLGASKGF